MVKKIKRRFQYGDVQNVPKPGQKNVSTPEV